MTDYFRPLAMSDFARPDTAHALAGGWSWFDRVEYRNRQGTRAVIPAADLPADVLERLTTPRAGFAGLEWDTPRLMGIVNVTPDSFSDGGQFFDPSHAIAHGEALAADGADILDIGGESTRPGADTVPNADEIARVVPVIEGLVAKTQTPISIDTRKAPVAEAALRAGAAILNDVSAMRYDPAMAPLAARSGAPICLMHAQGDPETMQQDPRYDDVVLDVYDHLERQVSEAEAAGIDRTAIIVDPGIGFGKTLEHNLALIRSLSLFHALGCVVLLGASRKKFIGTIGGGADAQDRVAGSVAVALAGIAQGVQILRVHDIKETKQAMALHMAISDTRKQV